MKSKIYSLSSAALMTAVLCVSAPMSIQIGAVPLSAATLVIYLSIYLLGWRRGTASCIVYILMGTFGLPVFSGFSGGIGRILGPTGGYIVGYIPMAVIGGKGIACSGKMWIQTAALFLGTAVCYLLGMVWFCMVMHMDMTSAFAVCVVPFLPGDVIKVFLAVTVGPKLKKRLYRAGVIG